MSHVNAILPLLHWECWTGVWGLCVTFSRNSCYPRFWIFTFFAFQKNAPTVFGSVHGFKIVKNPSMNCYLLSSCHSILIFILVVWRGSLLSYFASRCCKLKNIIEYRPNSYKKYFECLVFSGHSTWAAEPQLWSRLTTWSCSCPVVFSGQSEAKPRATPTLLARWRTHSWCLWRQMLLKIPSWEPRCTARAASALGKRLQLMPSAFSRRSSSRRPGPVAARWRKEVAKEAASHGSVATVSGGQHAIPLAGLPGPPSSTEGTGPKTAGSALVVVKQGVQWHSTQLKPLLVHRLASYQAGWWTPIGQEFIFSGNAATLPLALALWVETAWLCVGPALPICRTHLWPCSSSSFRCHNPPLNVYGVPDKQRGWP